MKIIYNNYIPFKGYKAINLFGIVFARSFLFQRDQNHEAIHTAQMKEMLYIFFYLWYVIEYVIRFFLFPRYSPYRTLSLEVEAYNNEVDLDYLKDRKPYSWLKYVKG